MSSTFHPDQEGALEEATIELFSLLGYQVVNGEHERYGENGTLGRNGADEVVLYPRLKTALETLNPELQDETILLAVEQLTRANTLVSGVVANQELYRLLKDGVKVTFQNQDNVETTETVRVIDWQNPNNNNFLAVQQFWMLSLNGLYKRRADIVLFVNGLPLVFIELKASHRRVEDAYRKNLSDYRRTIPQIFWYNAFIILSNGRHSRIGSITSEWEHFAEWKKISDEQEQGRISLETIILGTCEQTRLLDLVENFVLYKQTKGGLGKLIAKNHQFLGANNAVFAVHHIRDNQGRLGVFWHTQGAGKSYSMVFFSQKVLRRLQGNWTFLIVTDREELDDQIYQTFADVGVVPPLSQGKRKRSSIQAQSGDALKRLLREDHRYIFTLIQKFHTRDGQPYPELSERSDIIVITDEAHRSQYATFAANMRAALPNAAFIGFTGTPLIAGEVERTRQVFGEYVSVYDFRQSVEDGATVPLHYENRIPLLQLTNEGLNEDIETLLDEAMLDAEQEERLEREFAREYHLITREDRLETIARDIAEHYAERGFAGKEYHSKAMVVCIDKLTAVKMYHKVSYYWRQQIQNLENQIDSSRDAEEREDLQQRLNFMADVDMAVVISQAQGEIEFFENRGFDITPHRERMVREDLALKFKESTDPFKVVFVCAMWMTGFDAPSCSTIYLDKPMHNHTLMQTIARANRVFAEKQDGLIVDYIGVFREIEKALAIYGVGTGGDGSENDYPVQNRSELVRELRLTLQETLGFCIDLGIDLHAIQSARGFDREHLKNDAVEAVLVNDETRLQFFNYVRNIDRLYRAILPHTEAAEFVPLHKLLAMLAESIRSEIPDADISVISQNVEDILDASIIATQYVIEASPTDTSRRIDLSQIDFDALRAQYAEGHRRTAIERLRSATNSTLQRMVRENTTRIDYLQTFQQMIEEYNSGALNTEVMFDRLIEFVQQLTEEQQRSMVEQLTEEELAIFDLLTRPQLNLTAPERSTVKGVARELLETLKREKLVLDWRKRQQTREDVRQSIRIVLDKLPDQYDKGIYDEKCALVYQHIYEAYFGAGHSIYDTAA